MSVQLTWHVRTADVVVSDCDTWQPGMMTCGSTGRRHVAGGFGRLEVQLDQYEVTRVTTGRVTRGRVTSVDDVAG
jgi:hypothetical protein